MLMRLPSPFTRTTLPGLLVLALALAVPAIAPAGSLPDFTELVEKNSAAVVNISTKQKKDVVSQFKKEFKLPDIPEDSPFNEFFHRFFGEHFGEEFQGPEQFDAQSLGSGFVITEDGYVMTNYHVVKGADEILVRLSDHREFVAEVIGMDKRSDIAVLKIEADDLPRVRIGSTKDLKVGEWVLAIGSPFGFDHSVTAGIVSAKGRSLPSENYVPFIQTDVAINPGNSGGPLFDMDGKVVGVNSQIYSRTGGFMGLSFAIPIEMAMNVADQIRTKGRVTRGWLGVLIQDVTRELADSFGMDHPKGALIARVLPDSPAEKGGLQVGDIILAFNGEAVYDSKTLPPLVGASRVDRPADVRLLRDGREITLHIDIGELPDEEELDASGERKPQQAQGTLGLSLRNLTPALREEVGLADEEGVYVAKVAPGPALDAGIREGDLIQMIDKSRVKTVDEAKERLAALDAGRPVAVLILRDGNPLFLALRLPER